MYNGNYYSTLTDVPAYYAACSSPGGCLCQGIGTYLSVPNGWMIAPDNADSIAVAASHYWSTSCLALASGKSIEGLESGAAAGQECFSSGALTQSGNQYAVNSCNQQILIMCKCV